MEPSSHGRTRLLWPTTLRLPERPPKLIYFDLNHWIELSKALSGHEDGKNHRFTLDACSKAVGEGRAVFPLSEYIYAEIAKIGNYRQRHDLRMVIEQICRYMVLTSLSVVVTHEIESVLDQSVGPNPEPVGLTNYLDWGVSRAFGRTSNLRVKSASGVDITEEFRSSYSDGAEAFDSIILNAELELNRKAIDGPTPQEEPRLRALGWRPEVIVQGYERMTEDELDQARRFDENPTWRLGRTRDVVMAREVVVAFGDILAEGLEARGPDSFDLSCAQKREDLGSLFGAMPSLDVGVTLRTSLHPDPNHRWTNNDVFDIGALALTIPYCDVVVTDRAMWSHVMRHKLPKRYNTVVITRLSELPDHL